MEYNNYKERLEKALQQHARKLGALDFLPEVLEWLPLIINQCGKNSDNRRTALRIGQTILDHRAVQILAPACPDWTNENGSETGLGEGVSTLARVQMQFLTKIKGSGIPFQAIIVYPDQEADDKLLLMHSGGNANTFHRKIVSSIYATKQLVGNNDWQVLATTNLILDFKERASKIRIRLRADETLRNRFFTDTFGRIEFYKKIYPTITWDEAYERSIRKASYYLAIGTYAKTHGYLLSDYIATDMPWYNETEVGMLSIPTDFS